jgi:hypothetical protein
MLRFRSPKTLRNHFPEELSNSVAKATARVARTGYQMAISGRYPAMLLLLAKCQAHGDPRCSKPYLRNEPAATTFPGEW